MAKKNDPLGLKPSALPRLTELYEMYDELRQKDNVVGCYVGRKRRGGRSTGRTALVCGVREKIPPAELSEQDRIPPGMPWSLGRTRRRLQTDVIVGEPRVTYQQGAVLGPGDEVSRTGSEEKATIGVALEHPQWREVVTTAGHFGAAVDEQVTIQNRAGHGDVSFPGIVRRKALTELLDYALIEPMNTAPVSNLFRDRNHLGPEYRPTAQDVGKIVLVLPRDGKARKTRCQGVHGLLEAPDGTVLRDVVLTEGVTEGGDSGAPLIDVEGKVWGTLVGLWARSSVFALINNVLLQEGARLLS